MIGEVEARKIFNPSWLTIPERGLYTGVAIFGAVGSGKTSACMHPFARQLLGWQAENPQKREAVHSVVYNHFNLRAIPLLTGQFQAQPRRCTRPVASTQGGLIPYRQWRTQTCGFPLTVPWGKLIIARATSNIGF